METRVTRKNPSSQIDSEIKLSLHQTEIAEVEGLGDEKTSNNNDLNQVAHQLFSLKQWFAAGAHSCRIRKTGSAHCYLRISPVMT